VKWEQLTAQERNLLIHTKIMGKEPERCTDGQLDPYMSSYWSCTCGWISAFHLGASGSTEHNKPVPRYSESMGAAWLVVERMLARQEEEYYFKHFEWDGPRFKPSHHYLTNEGYPLGTTCWYVYLCVNDYCQYLCAKTPQEAICLAALRAVEREA